MAQENNDQRLRLAVNAALNQVSILSSNFRMMAGGMGADTKRIGAWCEYGWPQNVSFSDFYNLYERQGVAHGVVNLMADGCFENYPWVIQGDEFDEKKPKTPWEKDFERVAKKSKLWSAFHEADRMRLVGRFSGILVQVADGRTWDQPIVGAQVIKKLIPAWEGQLKPDDIDTSPTSATYGEPRFWNYKEGDVCPNGESILSPRDLKVHPDRIILIGDWRSGRSFLKAAYNAFVNLEKIEGGSGEGFLKNASARMSVNYDKDANLAQIAKDYKLKDVGQLHQAFNDAARELNNGMDRLLITQGATVVPLSTNMPDPSPHYSISMQTIAASTGIAQKLIVGMQTGERASTEDIKDFAKRRQGRREGQLTRDAEAIVEHLTRVKLVPAVPAPGDFEIMWEDLTESSQAEKHALAQTLVTMNKDNAGSGSAPLFTSAEIRETAGFEGEADLEDLPTLRPLPDIEPPAVGPVTE